MLKRRKARVEDFDLRIEKTLEGFRAWVLNPEDGAVAKWDFGHPFSGEPGIQEALLETAGGCRDLKPSRPPSQDATRDLGIHLFQEVFGGTVLAFWRQRLLGIHRAEGGLRLRLRLNDPELWDWPWELLYDPDRSFPAVDPATPVVRYIEMPIPGPPLRVRPPLKILVVTASPSGMSPIGVEGELEDLEKSLTELREEDWVEFDVLQGATREKLQRKLLEGDVHVFHFIGHGAFDASLGQGVIYLEQEDGSPDQVGGLELSTLLLVQPRLRLVILNACNGARGSQADPFASLMQSLVRAGLPAVIAMQSAVTDRAATTFARHFYQSLSERKPVDRAVTDARRAMFFLGSGEWGSPVLAMRAPDGRIIVPTRWEVLNYELRKIMEPWRNWLVVLLLLFLLGIGCWSLARRWFDPNLLFAFLNPSECPAPHGLPIAFVKVEPRGKPPFCISRFEVTQRLWKKVVGKVPTRRHGDALPVVRVSWEDTDNFLKRLEKRAPGAGFRLPATAEWGYAGRAGKKGNPGEPLPQEANCDNKEETDGYEGLAPVASFPPNAWGLYDMAGNVSEWVSDLDKSGKRGRRGGSFEHVPKNCSISYSISSKPDSSYYSVGFRIVRDPIPVK
jgi:hypothetical protein